MSNIFARLLEEGQKQQQQLQATTFPVEPPIPSPVNETPLHQNDSTTARQQTVETAGQSDSKLSRQHDSLQEYAQDFLQARSLNKTTLRYPQALMDELDEVIYQVKKTYHTSLSKNELFVLALSVLLHDFKRNATRSMIYKILIHEHEK